MSVEILGEFYDSTHDQAYLSVNGLGAFALMKDEAGLHQLDYRFREKTPRTGHETMREDRETIRVEVLPWPNGLDAGFRRVAKSKITALKPPRSRLVAKADLAVSLFHEASLRSLDLWTTGPREQAIERSLTILRAQVDSATAPTAQRGTEIIRHYDLGIPARVKDVRSGKSTTRVDRILKGHLDVLLR
jgi:hypothetical protein